MTKSNNKWVPEVGQEFEYKPWNTEERWLWALALCPDDDGIVFKAANGDYGNTNLYTCRPIKTEAEKRLDEREKELFLLIYKDTFVLAKDAEQIAWAISKEGWIKPKPLTEGVFESIWAQINEQSVYTSHFERAKRFAKAIEAYIRGEDLWPQPK